jgi:hypothetical protein
MYTTISYGHMLIINMNRHRSCQVVSGQMLKNGPANRHQFIVGKYERYRCGIVK